MKPSLFTVTVATAISVLQATTLLGQSAPSASTSSAGAGNRSHNEQGNQDAKEKSEDAALLQQLDSGETPPPPNNKWAPGGGAWGGGGKVGVVRAQTLLARPGGAPKALLVRTTNPDPKMQAALEEDLSVMAHILTKAIEDLPGAQAHPMNALGVDLFFTPGSTPMRSMYLDGYGALFFLNVGFPLIAPAEKTPEEKPVGDSAWEDAKQELYGRPQGNAVGEPTEEYSQEKVDKLKETLLEALKNASNIRDLKPEESVTLWVSGGASGGAGRFRVVKHSAPGARVGNTIGMDQVISPSRRTILTIRVKKADIDAYAKDKLSAQEFQKHAQITAYTGDPAGGVPEGFGGGYITGRNRF